MTKRIEKLTAVQIAAMPRYAAEWIGYGTCTKSADRPRAEAAIRLMYTQAGLKEPQIIWCASPLSMCLTKHVMESVGESVWVSVGESVRASVRASVGASVGESVWASVWESVGASVWESVGESVWASVWESVGASVWESVGASVGESVWASVGGQHEAHWLASYRFFAVECGLTAETDKLAGLWELCQSSGWVLPYRNICFASERHTLCALDERGLIHSETGPAVAYPDGFAIYAWHGTRVPAEWIEDRQSLTAETALAQKNTAIRIAAMQIVGWPKMIEQLDAKVINRHPEGLLGGELLAVKKAKFNPNESGEMRFLRAECPRNGLICFRVPDDTKTAHQAQAWAAGLPQSIFQLPSART